MSEILSTKEHLLIALDHYDVKIVADHGKYLDLEEEYQVEIETGFLFKLRWKGKVVAPFNDLDEMCRFIKNE